MGVERQTETDRQKDRKTYDDRQTKRQKDIKRQTDDRQTDRKTDISSTAATNTIRYCRQSNTLCDNLDL